MPAHLIECQSGNILDGPSEMLVVPVNCVAGVMGAGLAKAAAIRWPCLIAMHRELVEFGLLTPGGGIPVRPTGGSGPRPVLFFLATKDDWRQPTDPDWVRSGLEVLKEEVLDKPVWSEGAPDMVLGPEFGIASLAVPALGSGCGGLSFESVVRPMIQAWAARLRSDLAVRLYWPGSERRKASPDLF
jgi:hypothetical protein